MGGGLASLNPPSGDLATAATCRDESFIKIVFRGLQVVAELSGRRIVIAGGSGFLGLSMAEHFSKLNVSVTILSRSKPKLLPGCSHQNWDGRSLDDWLRAIDGADAIVNLSGRSVNCIKTPDHQDEILRSRIESTRVLGQAMRTVKSPPPVWVQMSTAHIYGTHLRQCAMRIAPRELALRLLLGEHGKPRLLRASCPASEASSCEQALWLVAIVVLEAVHLRLLA